MLGVFALAGITMVGCANTYYQVIRIPDTPDALAAYRQCATAPHFSEVGACLAGIPNVNTTGWLADQSQWKIHEGCRQIIWGDYGSRGDVYIYAIQACTGESLMPFGPPPAP